VTPAASNGAPSFSGGLNNQFVNEGASISYALPTIIDPETDSCSISITNMPSWGSFASITNTFTFSPPVSSAGTYAINFNLLDPYNTVPSTFSVIV
jgi:Putative Ig domain